MSDNPGMRWDIEETRRVIGYVARDGHRPIVTAAMDEQEKLVRLKFEMIERLERMTAKW